MKWYSTYKHPENLFFIINEDEYVGFYLYVYESIDLFKKDLENPEFCPGHQRDYLQDTLAMAQRYAARHLGVPLESWIEKEE